VAEINAATAYRYHEDAWMLQMGPLLIHWSRDWTDAATGTIGSFRLICDW
jgi:hypothetical protein